MRRHNPFRRLGELFDASALGLVTLLLLGASFYATWQGMGDFVTSKASGDAAGTTALVVLVVFTLTLEMYVALRETVNPIRKRNIIPAFLLYAVLALWSVGFGYGFWWSLIAGQDATEAALSRTVDSLSETTGELRAELAAGVALMDVAETLSEERAERERSFGGTCGVASAAGDGPLSRAREDTRSQIAALSGSVRNDWLDPVNARVGELVDVQVSVDIEGETPDARKARLTGQGANLRRTAQDISADATARGGILASQLRAKSEQLSLVPVSGAVDYCYDPDLAKSLSLVADALDGPFDIAVADFEFAEGADGVAKAVEDLWLGVFGRLGLVERPSSAGLALDGRSLIALMATIGIDLALFVFALLRGGMRREYDPVLPPAVPVIPVKPDTPIDGGGEAREVLEKNVAPALPAPPPEKAEAPKLRRRIETDPKAVGIGSTDADSQSQILDPEQVTDLIRSVDGRYRAMTDVEVIADRDEENSALKAELRALKQRGYIPTGRAGQQFDSLLHKQVGTQASDQSEGTIIATVRPGYITDGQEIYRIAHVIVSSGPDDFEF